MLDPYSALQEITLLEGIFVFTIGLILVPIICGILGMGDDFPE